VLQHGPIRVELDATSYTLPEDLRRVAPLALRTLRNGRVIFNGRVIGMFGDLLPATSDGTYRAQLRETGFFMGICSSELCQYQLIDEVTGQQTEVRLEHLLEPSGRLVTLASSGMANIIGISTLAFTTDEVLLMVWQSARNAASGKLLAPSGSGSLEPKDLEAAGPDASLQDVLRHGMEREFSEETGVSTDTVIDTRVIGFGRWLERGAKPEFFGVTRLNISSQHSSIARIKPAETVYSEGVAKTFVDLQRLRQELSEGYSVENAPSCPTVLRASGSLPLLVGLRAAALYAGELAAHEGARNT
jgi:hypothetical protein